LSETRRRSANVGANFFLGGEFLFFNASFSCFSTQVPTQADGVSNAPPRAENNRVVSFRYVFVFFGEKFIFPHYFLDDRIRIAFERLARRF